MDSTWSELLPYCTPEERAFINQVVLNAPLWAPLPGPQTLAFNHPADVIGYGGAAGGGKTDLAIGKALLQHRRVAIFRREGTQLTGVIDRIIEIIGSREGYNGQDKIFRKAGPRNVQIELGSVPNAGDEEAYQGRPKDFLVIEEATHFLRSQVMFLMGWVRTVVVGQKCQVLMTFNPPTTAEGRWVVDYFAPWLDPKYPRPAAPGEIRYFAVIDGVDTEVDSKNAFVVTPSGERLYEFKVTEHPADKIIRPQSRTFIPAKIGDNPYLASSGYVGVLQALPEPLRSQMLYGDFQAGVEDDPWQVCPTAWVEAAMARWKRPNKLDPMDAVGVDVARGGRDQTVISRRHGMWFDELLKYPGSQTPDGPKAAGLVVAAARNDATQYIDVIGVGSSVYDFLNSNGQDAIGVNVAESTHGRDKSGRLCFANKRSELWWRMREALDPDNNTGIALPPDKELLADLCAPKWGLRSAAIQVESRDDIVKRIQRSPDCASAVVLALMQGPKRAEVLGRRGVCTRSQKGYNPYDRLPR